METHTLLRYIYAVSTISFAIFYPVTTISDNLSININCQ